MSAAGNPVLTVNGGSSSIKFALFETGAELTRVLAGKIERIGLPGASLEVKDTPAGGDDFKKEIQAPDQTTAVGILMDWVAARFGSGGLAAVGHRVVHGGPKYREAQRVTPEMVEELRRITPFDPEHLPEEILLTEAFAKRFPQLPQVACFDTSFHADMPRVAQVLPIPRKYEARGVRRYGFHGLSYAYLMEELARVDPAAARGRVVLAHLGNGASLAAVQGGKPMDTTMGFTPTAGVPMSTRTGDLDPGLLAYLMSAEKWGPKEINHLVNFESGLRGVSEISSDMRELLEQEGQDARAADAVALFCYEVKKRIGGFAAAMGGVETVVFSGGIGENAPPVRWRACDNLEFLGIRLDAGRNAVNADIISAESSRVKVRVMRTDEERMMAKIVCGVLNFNPRK